MVAGAAGELAQPLQRLHQPDFLDARSLSRTLPAASPRPQVALGCGPQPDQLRIYRRLGALLRTDDDGGGLRQGRPGRIPEVVAGPTPGSPGAGLPLYLLN